MDVAALLDLRGPVGPEDLDGTLEAIMALRHQINALEAAEALLLERIRRQAIRAGRALLDESDPMVRVASPARRAELARRVAVAEVSLAVHQDERTVSVRMDRAQALVAKAPATLAGAVAGKASWANAARVADAVIDLEPTTAARLDAQVSHAATCQVPRQFGRTVRRTLDRLHPTPPEVRHAEAATARGVWTDRARDGMAYLTLFAPATAVHGIVDRLTQVGRMARAEGDGRTLAQLRADVACALLLDDGTLDLAAAASAPVARSMATPPGSAVVARSMATPPGSGPGAGSTPTPAGPAVVAGAAATSAATVPVVGAMVAPPASAGTQAPDADGVPSTPSDADAEGEPFEMAPEPFGRTAFSLAAAARMVRPKVYVTVPVLTLLGRSDEPALLDGTVPIDPDTARELAGLATSFTRLLTHPETGTVLAVGGESYRPPADLRHYLTVRDTTCRFPGCSRPASSSDVDHTRAHAAGGATTAENLAALCRRHHVLKHQSRFTVAQDADGAGTLTWTTPTGRVHADRPEPVPATLHRAPGPPPDFGEPPNFGDPPDIGDPRDFGDPPF